MRQEVSWNDFYSKNSSGWRGNAVIPIPNYGKALDLGCGNGKTVSTLVDSGYDVTGVDFSSVAIEQCKARFPDSTFVESSVCDLPFEDNTFDYITAVHVLEHLNDEELERTVSEIGRVLKESGFVFIRCFTENDMRSEKRGSSDIFYRFYDLDRLHSAFRDFIFVDGKLIEEPTRFGTMRSRVELIVKL